MRWIFTLVTGVAMFAIGFYVAMQPTLHRPPVTGARWLDLAFAAVFMIRGLFNVRVALNRRNASQAR